MKRANFYIKVWANSGSDWKRWSNADDAIFEWLLTTGKEIQVK